MRDAPNPDIYNKQPFFSPRIDLDRQRISAVHEFGLRFERALEVDEILGAVRAENPKSYTAVVIRYVLREPGQRSRKLDIETQLDMWYRATGLGRWAYYTRLGRVEDCVALALGA